MTAAIDFSIDPELRPVVPSLLAVTREPLTAAALAMMRGAVPPFLPRPHATPAWSSRVIAGISGAPPVRVLVIAPPRSGRPGPALGHLPGGGVVAGPPPASLWRTQEIAAALDCLVVSVDYRLAPETVFPGALADNYAALKWLWDSAGDLGVDRERIAVVGESAGGGHAAMLALAVRDRGEMALAFQGLVYPMLDDRTGSTVEVAAHIGTILWDAQRNRFGWSALLGRPAGLAGAPPGAVPARAASLAGLPPAWIGVGGIDLFFAEDIDFASALTAAGVPVRLTVVPRAFHLFDAFVGLGIADDFRADLITALRRALYP